MEADVTAMASQSSSKFDFRKHCVTCGTFGYWTPRVWDCNVCGDYFLCEICYKRSVEDCEVLWAPPQAHNHDHRMSPHMTRFGCDGCKSWPIWNSRWRCKVCFDIDLCEACYGELDAADMPPGHSKDHPMVFVDALGLENLRSFRSSFSKPVDPQWSYRVGANSSRSGFQWVKRKPMAAIFSTSQMSTVKKGEIIQTSRKTDENNGGHISKVEKRISLKRKGLASKEPSEPVPTQWNFDERFKIFLSHAGAEKDFVEQLHVDLSRVHHFGIFFDKDDGSLPKGESFPERIFDAAKHCELAIVVISAEYFVRKWPMLELAAFVKAQKTQPGLKILPVFYKLSVEEFTQPKSQQLYMRSWMQMSGISKDDIQLWEEALKVISRTNGIEYDKRMGEVAFREQIVEIVYKRVKPVLLWDDSHVQGKTRMHEMMEEKIQSSNNMAKDMAEVEQSTCTSFVGLYGMGGSGKSTLCKVFYNEMMQSYLGKVYYIEFGSMNTLELRKKLLQNMCLLDSSFKSFEATSPKVQGCNISSLSEDQEKAMENFVDRCNFEVEDMLSREYLPLALKVLGTRVGPNPKEWQNIKVDFKYYENENKHHIFSILRSSYDSLTMQHQRMFLDIALNNYKRSKRTRDNYLRWQMRCLYNERDEQFISNMVKVLQAKSLVEFYDVKHGLYIHDLYREFAAMEVEKRGLQHSPSCCFSRGSNGQHFVQEGRVRIRNQLISHVTRDILSCKICSEAQLLRIEGCPNLKSVDIPGMRNLRMFDIHGCPQLTSVNLEGAVNLQSLDWHGFIGEIPDLTSLESLEGLWLHSGEEELSASPFTGSLDFSRSSNLEILHLSYLPLNLLNVNQVVQLRVFCANDCQYLERLEGLEALVKLEELDLRVCSSLLEFPSLANFPSLKFFVLEGAAKLKELQGFGILTALETLSLRGGSELEELPGIEACTRLSRLDLSDTNLEDFSWISVMKDLAYIDLSGTKIRCLPDCSELSKLSNLWLDNCEALESLVTSIGIHPTLPQSLELISAKGSRRLKGVPQFTSESALQYLDISGTCVEEISGVMNCKYLEELFCAGTNIRSLPDLSSALTRLKVLDMRGCALLTRMDNIKSLPALEELEVDNCSSLLTLPDLGISKGLTRLTLMNCPLLDPKSVKLPTECPVDMEMDQNAADEQSDSESEGHDSDKQMLAMDSHELVPARTVWGCAPFIDLVRSWCAGWVQTGGLD